MMSEIKLINGNCIEVLKSVIGPVRNPVIVTDPPFNIGCRYKGYKDRMKKEEYLDMLAEVLSYAPSVVIHYPEDICEIAIKKGEAPKKIISWVYNSNTAKQHRDIAYWGIKPDMNKVKQPYKNPNDKKIAKRIAMGIEEGRLYDWWNINQVKNVSKSTINHPCVMPLEVMERVIGILPEGCTVIDPFCGSGTTGVACAKRGVPFIGIEINADYVEIANSRINEVIQQLSILKKQK